MSTRPKVWAHSVNAFRSEQTSPSDDGRMSEETNEREDDVELTPSSSTSMWTSWAVLFVVQMTWESRYIIYRYGPSAVGALTTTCTDKALMAVMLPSNFSTSREKLARETLHPHAVACLGIEGKSQPSRHVARARPVRGDRAAGRKTVGRGTTRAPRSPARHLPEL